MAEIPVQRKEGGSMWWLWLLLALLLVGLLIWWVTDDDDAAVDTADTMAVEEMTVTPAAGTELTDTAAIVTEPPQTLEGRPVRLTNVTVQSVVSDAGFWLDAGPNQRVYAALTETQTPQTPTEGRVDVTTGDTVDLTGTIRTGDATQQLAATGETTIPEGVDRWILVEDYRLNGGSANTAANTNTM